MMNNFFNNPDYRPFRWFIAIAIALGSWLIYADYTGWRIFTFGSQQQWNASGPGGHK